MLNKKLIDNIRYAEHQVLHVAGGDDDALRAGQPLLFAHGETLSRFSSALDPSHHFRVLICIPRLSEIISEGFDAPEGFHQRLL